MKKKIAIIVFLTVCVFIAWMFVAPRIRVDLAARSHDPAEMNLNFIAQMHKSSRTLPNKIQTGLIHLESGDQVKYWFISNHVQPGLGLTRFDFEDGQTAYLSGAYCCEVWVSNEAVKNKDTFLDYIAAVDGTPP
jgi:hypothetical protein